MVATKQYYAVVLLGREQPHYGMLVVEFLIGPAFQCGKHAARIHVVTVYNGVRIREITRIVRINNFRVDVDPHARILICPHINRPGVIGIVGSIMGESGINISGMQVGETEAQNTSLMVLTIDNDIPANVLSKVTAVDGIFDAKLVNFDAI